ncbi:hypothetical protein GCM10010390_78390 [Streptomyces mordarskii]|uniref:Secreted protein n=1 Tax=Streptomyces mordarskii TaxID=1226758 RepID=A0ABN1EDA3_9ACTN
MIGPRLHRLRLTGMRLVLLRELRLRVLFHRMTLLLLMHGGTSWPWTSDGSSGPGSPTAYQDKRNPTRKDALDTAQGPRSSPEGTTGPCLAGGAGVRTACVPCRYPVAAMPVRSVCRW